MWKKKSKRTTPGTSVCEYALPENLQALAPTKVESDHFPLGAKFDRIGQEWGSLLHAEGDSIASRSMHPDVVLHNPNGNEYHVYAGTGKQLDSQWVRITGRVAPAFGQPGGAQQSIVVLKNNKQQLVPIEHLVDLGYLRKLQ